ncbi:hypothetical protein B0J15DRAFT_123832 [Fusarium solani]|jgi:hypothetical protein|uniref:Transmembrane protein n=1 Tax=Fusarium solani TaxID=169388 RepID=A0A9P9RC80_FUSSL|nr:uncharacterized protein B0J15DRAFT_123832 [Fusarium solani]KAH7274236.1 hypothetical protein B0J15DRAFT_123832 [Fusarium solani]
MQAGDGWHQTVFHFPYGPRRVVSLLLLFPPPPFAAPAVQQMPSGLVLFRFEFVLLIFTFSGYLCPSNRNWRSLSEAMERVELRMERRMRMRWLAERKAHSRLLAASIDKLLCGLVLFFSWLGWCVQCRALPLGLPRGASLVS